MRRAFTLVELLAAIAIIAALTTASLYFVGGYVQYAQQNADKQTLTVLNDALTRYKCEGGNIAALTAGAPIGNIITRLQAAVTWGGNGGPSHQFLQKGITYPASKINAGGTGSGYIFWQYNNYDGYANGTVTKPTSQPYGNGIGYISNSGVQDITLGFQSTSHYLAWKTKNGTITGPTSQWATVLIPAGTTDGVTFWSCSSNSTNPSGGITEIGYAGQGITALDVSGLSSLTRLDCFAEPINTLDVTHNPALTYLSCWSTNLSALDLRNNTLLDTVYCADNNIAVLDISNCTILNTIDCASNHLGPIYLGGHTPASFTYTPQKSSYTPSLQ